MAKEAEKVLGAVTERANKVSKKAEACLEQGAEFLESNTKKIEEIADGVEKVVDAIDKNVEKVNKICSAVGKSWEATKEERKNIKGKDPVAFLKSFCDKLEKEKDLPKVVQNFAKALKGLCTVVGKLQKLGASLVPKGLKEKWANKFKKTDKSQSKAAAVQAKQAQSTDQVRTV